MHYRKGRIDLVRWQERTGRAAKPMVSGWAVFQIVCALAGFATLAAQATGALKWSLPWEAASAGLVLLAISGPVIAGIRAVLTWIVG